MRFDFEGPGAEKKSVVLVLILFVNLLLISSQVMLRNRQTLLQTALAGMIAPLQGAFQRSHDFVVESWRRHVFLRGIYRKYQTLKQANVALRLENLALRRRLADQRTWAQARRKLDRFLLASVISIDTSYPFAALVINRGTRDGLAENQAVLNADAELVGRIVPPLTAGSARVRLITNPQGGTGAALESNMLEGLLKGENRPECRFQYLLAGRQVRIGERVVTSGTDLIYPPFLPIGRVTAVSQDYLAQTITVRPFFVDKPIGKLVVLLHE